jgi:hypothetical protein
MVRSRAGLNEVILEGGSEEKREEGEKMTDF